jgi:hypothetical protein
MDDGKIGACDPFKCISVSIKVRLIDLNGTGGTSLGALSTRAFQEVNILNATLYGLVV